MKIWDPNILKGNLMLTYRDGVYIFVVSVNEVNFSDQFVERSQLANDSEPSDQGSRF